MTLNTDNLLIDIQVLANNAKNVLAMVAQNKECEKLSAGARSTFNIVIDSLYKIEQMAEEIESSESLDENHSI